MADIIKRDRIFATPWFEVIAKTLLGGDPERPFYTLKIPDCAVILALTPDRKIPLVRQYRPAVEQYTLELPSGHIESGISPEQTARQELLEETGYEATTFDFLGCLVPDAGRISNRMWCYFAAGVTPAFSPPTPEAGLESVLYTPEEFVQAIERQEFEHALHLAVFCLALLGGKLGLGQLRS